MRFAILSMGTLVLIALSACIRPSTPIDPSDAPSIAAGAVSTILGRSPGYPPRFAEAPSEGSTTVRVWYPDHPLMRRLAMPETRAAFAEAHPGVQLEAQNIGEWMYAVQKLTVHLAGGGLPDIAIVRRDLLAQLAPSGKLVALEALLPPEFLEDLEPPVMSAFSVGGALVALPADAYHSVLFLDAKATLDRVEDLGSPLSPTRLTAGHIPFLEVMWAHGGDVLADGAVVVDDQAAAATFRLLHALYAGESGLSDRYAVFDETHGLALFTSGRVPLTVASSRMYRRILEEKPDTQVRSMPGEFSGISRWGAYAIVVLDEAEASPEAIAAVLDFLTGADLQGADALVGGSPPVRRSVRATVDPGHPLLSTFHDAIAPPLVPEWGEIEAALLGIVERVSRF